LAPPPRVRAHPPGARPRAAHRRVHDRFLGRRLRRGGAHGAAASAPQGRLLDPGGAAGEHGGQAGGRVRRWRAPLGE
jgi:hypothetical protein